MIQKAPAQALVCLIHRVSCGESHWYAEVFGEVGNSLHTTKVFDNAREAAQAAFGWCQHVGFNRVEMF